MTETKKDDKTISVTKALSELKMIGKKIEDGIRRLNPVAMYIGKKPPKEFESIEDFKSKGKAAFQSVNNLVDRYAKLKGAIVRSNAVTKVDVGSKNMTVAEAIEKKSSIAFKKMLLQQLESQYARVMMAVDTENRRVELRLQTLLEASYGKDVKVNEEDHDKIAKPFTESNEAKLADALGDIKRQIDDLRNEIDEFVLNVDVALSEINSRTDISIE